jgi:SPP1 family predicted phage head-tail adaptor
MSPKPTGVRWQPLEPGQLRNQISFAAPSATQDSFGQPLTSWPTYFQTWAQIRMLSGQELFQSDEFTSASQYRISIRWPGAGITINVGDRVLFGARTFVVQIADNLEMRNIRVDLTCLEINGAS